MNHERWLVSYADFITLLFAFFTTLYAISTVDQKKVGRLQYSMRTAFNTDFFAGVPNTGTNIATIIETLSSSTAGDKNTGIKPGDGAGGPSKDKLSAPAAENRDRLQALSRKLGELTVDPMLKGKVQIRMEPRGLVVSLAEAGFFSSGSSGVKPDAVNALLALARTFDDPIFHITVEGHTDNVPVKNTRFASNWELSTARASTVIALLIEKGGIPPTRMSAAGYGEFKPVSANDSDEGRARNRRVDIVIAPQTQDVPAEEPTAHP